MNIETRIKLASTKAEFLALWKVITEDPAVTAHHRSAITAAMRAQHGLSSFEQVEAARDLTRQAMLRAIS